MTHPNAELDGIGHAKDAQGRSRMPLFDAPGVRDRMIELCAKGECATWDAAYAKAASASDARAARRQRFARDAVEKAKRAAPVASSGGHAVAQARCKGWTRTFRQRCRATNEKGRTLIRIVAATLLALSAGAAQGQRLFVPHHMAARTVNVPDAAVLSSGCRQCLPMGTVCSITLRPGIYLDPAVNIYYYRTISFTGDCSNPGAVIFRATKPGAALVWIQDHAIRAVSCLALESDTSGTIGIAGRQHIIADYSRVIFGAMLEGMHVDITEFSIASCLDSVWITGDAQFHVVARSKLNLGCSIMLTEPRRFAYFVNAQAFSIIDAQNSQISWVRGNRCRLQFMERNCARAGGGVSRQRTGQLLN